MNNETRSRVQLSCQQVLLSSHHRFRWLMLFGQVRANDWDSTFGHCVDSSDCHHDVDDDGELRCPSPHHPTINQLDYFHPYNIVNSLDNLLIRLPMKFRDRWFDLDLPLAFSSTESKRNCAEVESACLSLKSGVDEIRRRSLPSRSSYLSN